MNAIRGDQFLAIVVRKYNFSYTPVPKNACTSLKRLMFFLENGSNFVNSFRSGKQFHIHNFYFSENFSERQLPDLQGLWNFAVVRDPVVSAGSILPKSAG